MADRRVCIPADTSPSNHEMVKLVCDKCERQSATDVTGTLDNAAPLPIAIKADHTEAAVALAARCFP
jgi:hypothetical protein